MADMVELTFYHKGKYSKPIPVPRGSVVEVRMGNSKGTVYMNGTRMVSHNGDWRLDGVYQNMPKLYYPQELAAMTEEQLKDLDAGADTDMDHLGPRKRREGLWALWIWVGIALIAVIVYAVVK